MPECWEMAGCGWDVSGMMGNGCVLICLRAAAGFDAVLSDMAPSTTGVAAADVAQSLDLAQHAADLALGGEAPLLAPRGNLIVKLLEVRQASAAEPSTATLSISLCTHQRLLCRRCFAVPSL